jgi:hypothetical protein
VIDQRIQADNNRGIINQTNINQAPAPEVRWGPKKETHDASGGTTYTQYELEVVSPYPVAGVWFEVYGNDVRFDVAGQRPGLQTMGHTGVREGYAFTTIQQAHGRYKLSATSNGPIEKIHYGFD